MVKESKFKNKMSIKSYTDINYKDLPSSHNMAKITDKDVASINSKAIDMPSNYEEVNDYSFLNVVTEEITTLDSISSSEDLKDILKGSLVDIDNNSLYKSISIKEINNVMDSLNINECKALLHNIDNISYLEIVDQASDNSYRLQLSNEGYSNFDSNSLDDILTYLIENRLI